MTGAPQLWIWRHPRPEGAAGRCIGRTDLAVDRRRAKRLAHRVRALARREGLPPVVHTSPLRRAADVGRWLRRWGWRHVVHADWSEAGFGAWDGQPWSRIPWHEVAAWEAAFATHAPGGGESQRAVRARVFAMQARLGGGPVLAVGHGGWISAWRAGREVDDPRQWPPAPRHGVLTCGPWLAPATAHGGAPAWHIAPADPADPEARPVLDALSEALAAITGSSGRASFDAADVRGPRALFVLARHRQDKVQGRALGRGQGRAQGCGALRPLDAGTVELKRMYAAPGTQGLGAALLAHLEARARGLGYRQIWLETRAVNARAVAFYTRHGYRQRPAYGRYVGRPEALCFEKPLWDDAPGPA